MLTRPVPLTSVSQQLLHRERGGGGGGGGGIFLEVIIRNSIIHT